MQDEKCFVNNSLKILKTDICCSLRYFEEYLEESCVASLSSGISNNHYLDYLNSLSCEYHSLVLWQLNHLSIYGLLGLQEKSDLYFKYLSDRERIRKKYDLKERMI